MTNAGSMNHMPVAHTPALLRLVVYLIKLKASASQSVGEDMVELFFSSNLHSR